MNTILNDILWVVFFDEAEVVGTYCLISSSSTKVLLFINLDPSSTLEMDEEKSGLGS